jgi:cell shape-determining protein MreC
MSRWKQRLAGASVLALLLGQLALLSSQASERGGGPTRLESFAMLAVAPAARLVSGALDLARSTGAGFKSAEALRSEVARLQNEVSDLRRENQRLLSLDDQVERLSNALGYRAPFEGQVRLADVVYIDHTSWLQTLFLFMPGVRRCRQRGERRPTVWSGA